MIAFLVTLCVVLLPVLFVIGFALYLLPFWLFGLWCKGWLTPGELRKLEGRS